MNPEQIANLRRLLGDAKDVVNKLEHILLDIKDDERVLFEIRQTIIKCDYISSTLETEFVIKERIES